MIGNATPAVDLPPISAALSAYACIIVDMNGNWGSIMKDVATAAVGKVDKKIAQKTDQSGELSTDRTELDRRYGQIGISAVAAAARYLGAAKNPAYAPAPARWTGPAGEAA